MSKIVLFIILFLYSYAFNLKISSIKAKFVQTITNEQNATIRYSGRLIAKDNSKAVWYYEKPIIKQIYLTTNEILVVEPELEQVIYTNLNNSIDFIKILQEAKRIDENRYEAKCCQKTFQLFFEDGVIRTVKYKNQISDLVEIEFFDVEFNKDINDSIFKPTIPSYYDIITE
jgi:outer membrane lipoprotein carrier protein